MREKQTDIGAEIAGWLGLTRPPFHTLGILPFFLGTVVAWRLDTTFDLRVFILSILGVILVMLASYHAGEYFDSQEDERSKRLFRSRLAGGSDIIPDQKLPRVGALWTSMTAIVLAAIVGLILQFGLGTGPLTLPFACIGALPCFFYSARPIHLIDKGFGELAVGFCYGWLPLASAFYIQRGYIAPCVHWMSLPIGLSIFNVLLLNEFLHIPVTAMVGKMNLLALMGTAKAAILFIVVSILSWICMYALNTGIPVKALYLYLPVMALSAVVSLMMARGKYENPLLLELLCGLTLAVNLGTTAVYILAFL